MQKTSLAKPIRFSNQASSILGLIFVLMLAVHLPIVHADEGTEGIITKPSSDMLDYVRRSVEQFQATDPSAKLEELQKRSEEITRSAVCGGDSSCSSVNVEQYTDAGDGTKAPYPAPGQPVPEPHPKLQDVPSGQSASQNSHRVRVAQGAGSVSGTAHSIPDKRRLSKPITNTDDRQVSYFFSFSMPPESLHGAILDARAMRQKGLNVTLVLRGLVQNNLNATVSAFNKLIQETGIKEDLPVEIDPPLYEAYNVAEVPVIVLSSQKGTGKMTGDVSLSYALSRFDKHNGLYDYGKLAPTYEIAEEDMMKLVASKQPLIEEKLRQRIESLKQEMYILKKYDGRFEKAKEDRVYYVNPSVVLTDDIKDHEGRVVFAKGSVFNPTNYVRLPQYIIIDGHDPYQVQLALAGNYRKVMIISGDLAALTAQHGKQFWFATDDILARFQIQRVPAIIDQEGEYVRITEKAL